MRVSFVFNVLVSFGLVIFLQACDGLKATNEAEQVPVSKKISTNDHAKPPVDMSLPDKTETATFALG